MFINQKNKFTFAKQTVNCQQYLRNIVPLQPWGDHDTVRDGVNCFVRQVDLQTEKATTVEGQRKIGYINIYAVQGRETSVDLFNSGASTNVRIHIQLEYKANDKYCNIGEPEKFRTGLHHEPPKRNNFKHKQFPDQILLEQNVNITLLRNCI